MPSPNTGGVHPSSQFKRRAGKTSSQRPNSGTDDQGTTYGSRGNPLGDAVGPKDSKSGKTVVSIATGSDIRRR